MIPPARTDKRFEVDYPITSTVQKLQLREIFALHCKRLRCYQPECSGKDEAEEDLY